MRRRLTMAFLFSLAVQLWAGTVQARPVDSVLAWQARRTADSGDTYTLADWERTVICSVRGRNEPRCSRLSALMQKGARSGNQYAAQIERLPERVRGTLAGAQGGAEYLGCDRGDSIVVGAALTQQNRPRSAAELGTKLTVLDRRSAECEQYTGRITDPVATSAGQLMDAMMRDMATGEDPNTVANAIATMDEMVADCEAKWGANSMIANPIAAFGVALGLAYYVSNYYGKKVEEIDRQRREEWENNQFRLLQQPQDAEKKGKAEAELIQYVDGNGKVTGGDFGRCDTNACGWRDADGDGKDDDEYKACCWAKAEAQGNVNVSQVPASGSSSTGTPSEEGSPCDSMRIAWGILKAECEATNWESYNCQKFVRSINKCGPDPAVVRPGPDGDDTWCPTETDPVELARERCEFWQQVWVCADEQNCSCELPNLDRGLIANVDICSDPRTQVLPEMCVFGDPASLGGIVPEPEPLPPGPDPQLSNPDLSIERVILD